MSVYKELFYTAKLVAGNSKRIYNDADDFGAPVKSLDDPIISWIKSVKDQYDGHLMTLRYDTGATQTVTIPGYDEWNTGKKVIVQFVFVTTKGNKDMIGYVYVKLDGVVQP